MCATSRDTPRSLPRTHERQIASLPSSTKSKLRSTQILTSLPQLVSELVQNSLDAGARHIDVSINPEEWECWVRDDGSGISRDGLALLAAGPDVGRYSTSKAHRPISFQEVTTFGFRGEALASVANLSCLEICSRTKQSDETWSIILKGEQTLYAGPAIRWRRTSSGTVVSVKDVFYNLPIRRRSHPNPSRTLELVKKEIESLALVFPDTCFSLENSRKAKGGQSVGSKARVLTIPKTGSIVAAFRHLHGKALANHIEEIHETFQNMELNGFISLDGATGKAHQFLYVNKHPMETCALQHSIDSVFARSSFSKHAYDEHGATSSPRSAVRRSPRKTDKKPVYVLNLTIPPRYLDNCVDPAKTAVQLQDPTTVATFLSSVVESVLAQHGFMHDVQRSRRGDGTPSPRKKRKIAHTDQNDDQLPTSHLSRSLSQANSILPLPHSIVRHGSFTLASLPAIREAGLTKEAQETSDILWTDPATGETFIIDWRTGHSYSRDAPANQAGVDTTAVPVTQHLRRSLGGRSLVTTTDAPAWIMEALQANESYKLAERKIRALAVSADLAPKHACDHKHGHSHPRSATGTSGESGQQLFASWDASQVSRFSREELRAARVLGQVDKKFVACVMRPRLPFDGDRSDNQGDRQGQEEEGGAGVALVLIDQHAADERIRVERFLQEVCEGFLSSVDDSAVGRDRGGEVGTEERKGGVRVKEVDPPVHVLLTRQEAGRIVASEDAREGFARWGVIFAKTVAASITSVGGAAVETELEDSAYIQMSVSGVPEVVADKLLSGDELRDLIKRYLARLETNGPESAPSSGQCKSGEGVEWQKALRWCPQELVELINSKACRGAIMFNDTLTIEQCKGLVSRLSETALPFQCAHGRPSLVPLVDTGGARYFVPTRRRIEWKSFVRYE